MKSYDSKQTIKAVNNCFRKQKNNVKLHVVALHHLARTLTHVYEYLRNFISCKQFNVWMDSHQFLDETEKNNTNIRWKTKTKKSIIIYPLPSNSVAIVPWLVSDRIHHSQIKKTHKHTQTHGLKNTCILTHTNTHTRDSNNWNIKKKTSKIY